ncbi:extracellular solute-binding protein [Rhodospirillum rubrum F11]|nr:extracellular solute-binding protein [Rhodospirillum rubrum F11]
MALLMTAWIVLTAPAASTAAEFRWTAAQGPATLEPQSPEALADPGVLGDVYETLIGRDSDLDLEPALATAWQAVTDLRWRVTLRRGVRFHDGAAFTADDVVASLERASARGGGLAEALAPVRRVRRVDDTTVDLYTQTPTPDLPQRLALIRILDDGWIARADPAMPANGTGPFRVDRFTPGGAVTLVANGDWWGRTIPADPLGTTAPPAPRLERATLIPAARPADRLRLLLEGKVDLALDLPPAVVPPLAATPGLRALVIGGTRTVMLGMDQRPPPLGAARGQGSPFRDRLLREAVLRAVDMTDIDQRLFANQATPAALIAGPMIAGVPAAADIRPAADPDRARALLAEAGVGPAGVSVTLDCPLGFFLNDGALCDAIATSLSEVGIHTAVATRLAENHFPRVLRGESRFFLTGYQPLTLDILDPLRALAACPPTDGSPKDGFGQANGAGYCDPSVDRLIRRLADEMIPARQSALAAEIVLKLRDDVVYVPLHQEPVIWGARADIGLRQRADGVLDLRWVSPAPVPQGR